MDHADSLNFDESMFLYSRLGGYVWRVGTEIESILVFCFFQSYTALRWTFLLPTT